MMLVKITQIVDPGIPNNERLVMKAIGAENLGKYMVFDTKEAAPGRIVSRPKNVYWFPDQPLRAGDIVVLYTKAGVNTKFLNQNGTYSYFYYWGQKGVLWHQKGDSAALLKVESWEYKSRI